jgi:hypothetical protein
MTKYFGLTYEGRFTAQELRERIDTTTLVRYGRFRLIGDGDKIRTAILIDHDPSARDNSFVRVCSVYVSPSLPLWLALPPAHAAPSVVILQS